MTGVDSVPRADRCVDETDARYDILGSFGRSDRRAQRAGHRNAWGLRAMLWARVHHESTHCKAGRAISFDLVYCVKSSNR